MEVAVLVANPAASQFTGGMHRKVVGILSSRYRVETRWPTSPVEAQAAATEAVMGGAGLVVAMGGDGVVHHVAQGLVSSTVPLGIVPVGTTNVLARLLGIPRRPAQASRLLVETNQVNMVPSLEVQMRTERGTAVRHALFALGAGADALVVERAETEPYRKYRFGGLHYARTAAATVWSDLRRRRPRATVQVAGRALAAVGFMAQIHPVYTFFGRVPIKIDRVAPDPMTVLVVSRLPLRRIFGVARAAFGGGFERLPGFEVVRGVESLSFEAPRPTPVQADGEILGEATRLDAAYRPSSLPVVVPAVPASPR
ncbi:MAG: diacylglycerol kinase [Acidimicrobiia bacterium]|nr:MAG: diacylglycerol kinase [Acidimicrobiia bacterium]